MKDKISLVIKAILAGCAISLGGIANICSQNKIVGSLFFVIGLFLVLVCDLNLFTGKVCYALDNKPKYIISLFAIYLGNLVGALICGYLLGLIYNQQFVFDLNAKLNVPFWQVIIKGIFCNVLIYIAVDGYKTFPKEWEKALALFFGVSVFVLCGFEHSIADMFYISYSFGWSGNSILFLLEVTLGNIIGGLLLPLVKKAIKPKIN